ncbi:MAG: DtxR family transcriptional regulator [Candidatus Aenigmarchaeota archaeon]|nr:DtxR family transcriptional regulator [Candidatus Aenigmarchaeota archaeon]
MTSENVEEYLEIMYRMKEKGIMPTTITVARELGISPASVSEMLVKLAKAGYIKHTPYRGATLTAKGEKIGKNILSKHRTIEKFLNKIGFPKNKSHEQACEMEHVVSDELERVIRNHMDHRKNIKKKGIIFLDDLERGMKARIVSIESGRMAKRRMEEMGLTPGTEIKIGRKAPAGGPVEVCVRGSCLVIGRGLAKKVIVEI